MCHVQHVGGLRELYGCQVGLVKGAGHRVDPRRRAGRCVGRVCAAVDVGAIDVGQFKRVCRFVGDQKILAIQLRHSDNASDVNLVGIRIAVA